MALPPNVSVRGSRSASAREVNIETRYQDRAKARAGGSGELHHDRTRCQTLSAEALRDPARKRSAHSAVHVPHAASYDQRSAAAQRVRKVDVVWLV